MGTFELVVTLGGFDDDGETFRPIVGTSVRVKPQVWPWPDVDANLIRVDVASKATDAAGEARFELAILPGLVYFVSALGALPTRTVSADQVDDAVVRLEDVISPVPSPISPVDAAELRAEVLERIADIEAGATSWADVSGKPATFPPSAHNHDGSYYTKAQVDGLLADFDPPAGGGSDALVVVAGGTVELDDELAEGTLLGYRVKASTTFEGEGGSSVLAAGAYTFERTADGWIYYPAAGGSVLGTVVTPPADGLVDEMLADDPAYLFMLDDAPGTTKPANLGSGTINTSDEAVIGGVTFGVDSIGGGGTCAEFDGTGYIRTGIPFGDANGKSAYTIVWLMEATTPTGDGSYVYEGGAFSEAVLQSWGISLYTGTKTGTFYGAKTMMAGVVVGGRTKIYRDGVEIADVSGWAPLAGSDKSPMIGAPAGGATTGATSGAPGKFLGKLAAVGIYHSSLSADRLLAYAESAGVA